MVSSFASNINGFYIWKRMVCPMLSMQESAEMWRRVDPETKAYYRSLSQMENRQTKGNEASVKARLLALADRPGPLGSVHPKHPVRVKELHDLLNQPSSSLSDLWRRTSVDQWNLKYGNPTPEHTMTIHAEKIARSCNVPGKNCTQCAKTRISWMFWLAPLRSALQDAFQSMAGANNGVTLCLIWGKERRFFDLVLVFKRPESYLAMPINPATYYEERETALGRFNQPKSYLLEAPDVFNGAAYCLMEFCIMKNKGCPPYVAFSRKNGVRLHGENWICDLNEEFTIVDTNQIDTKAFLTKGKGNITRKDHYPQTKKTMSKTNALRRISMLIMQLWCAPFFVVQMKSTTTVLSNKLRSLPL